LVISFNCLSGKGGGAKEGGGGVLATPNGGFSDVLSEGGKQLDKKHVLLLFFIAGFRFRQETEIIGGKLIWGRFLARCYAGNNTCGRKERGKTEPAASRVR